MVEQFKRHYVSVDMYKTSSDTFEVVEGDTANLIIITLTDRGNPVDLTDCKVLVVFVRGGVPAQQDTDGNGVTISGEHHNIITVDLYSSSYVNGSNTAEVVVLSGESFGRQATSAWFNFKARRARINNSTILAVPQFPLLSKMLETLGNIARGVQAKWSTTNTEDPTFIQDKPVIGTDIQAPTNSLTVNYSPVGTDAVPIFRTGTGHLKTTFASILGYIRTQLDTYFASYTHKTRHAAGGADALSPSDIGAATASDITAINTNLSTKADLEGTVVKASQARSLVNTSHTSSFTLVASEAEQQLVVGNSSAAVVTIPRDATNIIPLGASFMIWRLNAALTFTVESGVQVLANGVWLASGTVATISAIGGTAFMFKYGDGVWVLKCE